MFRDDFELNVPVVHDLGFEDLGIDGTQDGIR
jgi:hypothetical protein